jgi:hypothetical protein
VGSVEQGVLLGEPGWRSGTERIGVGGVVGQFAIGGGPSGLGERGRTTSMAHGPPLQY